MRILSVVDTMRHGGAESVMVNLIEEMAQHKHMVIHFSSFFKVKPSEYLLEKLKKNSIPVKDIDYSSLKKIEIQKKFLDEFPADIVLYYWWGNDPLLTWRQIIKKNKLTKPKFICIIHTMKPNKIVQTDYDFYVAVSKSASIYQNHIPPEKKRVIYNGIDVGRFDVSGMRRDKDKFIIGRVSTLLRRKIPKNWVKFANTFDIKDVHFVIAGDGPRRKEFLNDIKELGVENKFSLLGYIHQEELPNLLSTFDICCYVTSTHIEAHSLALIECASAGLPIVAQPKGGIPEQVIHGETGFLSNDMDEIKHYCELLARDSDLREKMSRKAREFGMQFSIRRQCKEYGKLFEDLAKE